jgi:crotonobetainyl-CoA:carnitine CoA-transferase CaiB-like acyl-CoA transferase
VKTIGLPVKFSDTPGKIRMGAPVYGEHTREVLRQYGFDDARIEALVRDKAVFAVTAPDDEAGQQVA